MDETSDIVTIIDNEYMALFYSLEDNILHHAIRKRLPNGEFIKLLETGLECLIKYKGSKWLSDDRGHHHVTPEENDWLDGSWAPRAIQAGFRYWAVISPSKGLGKIQMRRFIQEFADRGVEVKMFEDPSQALEWLKSR